MPAQRHSGWIYGMARLQQGVTVVSAARAPPEWSVQLDRDLPGEYKGTRHVVAALRAALDTWLDDRRSPSPEALVALSGITQYTGAVIAVRLFEDAPPTAVVWLRGLAAAVILRLRTQGR